MKDGGPITVQHGGDGGVESLSLELTGNIFIFGSSIFTHSLGTTENQKLIAVYGRRLNNEGDYGTRKYVSCIIVITFLL